MSAFNAESRHPPLTGSHNVNEKIVVSCLTNKPPKKAGQVENILKTFICTFLSSQGHSLVIYLEDLDINLEQTYIHIMNS